MKHALPDKKSRIGTIWSSGSRLASVSMKPVAQWGLKRVIRMKNSTTQTTGICEETLHMRIGGGRSEVLDGGA